MEFSEFVWSCESNLYKYNSFDYDVVYREYECKCNDAWVRYWVFENRPNVWLIGVSMPASMSGVVIEHGKITNEVVGVTTSEIRLIKAKYLIEDGIPITRQQVKGLGYSMVVRLGFDAKNYEYVLNKTRFYFRE